MMSEMDAYDGHATKRQRTDLSGRGTRRGGEDGHTTEESAVIHVRGLADTVIEADIIESAQQFGPVSYVLMMPKRRQALVEFEDISGARSLIQYTQNGQLPVGNYPAMFNYSTSTRIQRPNHGDDSRGNKVLLFTILNPQYPVNVDVMNTICSQSGTVERIVIFKKNGVQCMVEFDSVETARRAKQALNGADIYSGCCTLKIEYAKPTKLNVHRNDADSWDYTNPHLGKDNFHQQMGGKGPLLADPRYGAGPTRYASNDPMGGGRGGLQAGRQGGYEQMGGDSYDGYGRQETRGYDQGRTSYDNGRSGYGATQDRYGQDPYGQQSPARGGFGAAAGYQAGYGGDGGQQGMYHHSAVLMIYGLNMEKMNCQRLFNMLCLYGNVIKIKFLKSKDGAAMVQMGDPGAVDRVMKNLNGVQFFGTKIQLGNSKQEYLVDVAQPHELPDGTLSFMDFMGSRNNRFNNPEAAARNRIFPPGKSIYYYNAPPGLTQEEISKLFTDHDVAAPCRVKIFPSKNDRSSTGIIEWEDKTEALEGIIVGCHSDVPNPKGKNPYVFKMNFAASTIGGGP